jgi:hypothetical protein
VAAALGCGDEQSLRLADALEGMEVEVPLEAVAKVPLGEFNVPLAISVGPATPGGRKQDAKKLWMRLKFELTAETAPKAENAVRDAYDGRRGAVNDAVLSIIRTSTVDDLTDPRLAAIKSRMVDAVRPLLGQHGVRQLVLNQIVTEPL